MVETFAHEVNVVGKFGLNKSLVSKLQADLYNLSLVHIFMYFFFVQVPLLLKTINVWHLQTLKSQSDKDV